MPQRAWVDALSTFGSNTCSQEKEFNKYMPDNVKLQVSGRLLEIFVFNYISKSRQKYQLMQCMSHDE